MNRYQVWSGQLHDWSDRALKNALPHASAKTEGPLVKTATPCRGAQRFADRALQAVWETRLLVHPRTWARPEVLSVSEHPRWTSENAVRACCSTRSSCTVAGQLPAVPRTPREDLGDQLRAPEAKRGTRVAHDVCKRKHRLQHGRDAGCQHDSRLSRVVAQTSDNGCSGAQR